MAGKVQVKLLEDRDYLVVRKIQTVCCGRLCLPGQSVLVSGGSPGDPIKYTVLHRRCLLGILKDMPQDQDERAFNELRDSIVASGNIF